MIDWLLDWWAARQRAIDIALLWPICCRAADDEDMARFVFAVHTLRDWPWQRLDEETRTNIILNLPYRKDLS